MSRFQKYQPEPKFILTAYNLLYETINLIYWREQAEEYSCFVFIHCGMITLLTVITLSICNNVK